MMNSETLRSLEDWLDSQIDEEYSVYLYYFDDKLSVEVESSNDMEKEYLYSDSDNVEAYKSVLMDVVDNLVNRLSMRAQDSGNALYEEGEDNPNDTGDDYW